MRFVLDKQEGWSKFALQVVLVSVVGVTVLSLADGVLRGPFQATEYHGERILTMLLTWCMDFRSLFAQLVYAGAIVFIGSKFIETRTIFMVGFDKLDAAKVNMKGPDEDNIVWIGHRYGSRMEAETVAATIESRLKESAG